MAEQPHRRCAFCGNDGPLTREHVFPQWTLPDVDKLGVPPRSVTRVTQPGREMLSALVVIMDHAP